MNSRDHAIDIVEDLGSNTENRFVIILLFFGVASEILFD
jgi:hypothetical protein